MRNKKEIDHNKEQNFPFLNYEHKNLLKDLKQVQEELDGLLPKKIETIFTTQFRETYENKQDDQIKEIYLAKIQERDLKQIMADQQPKIEGKFKKFLLDKWDSKMLHERKKFNTN